MEYYSLQKVCIFAFHKFYDACHPHTCPIFADKVRSITWSLDQISAVWILYGLCSNPQLSVIKYQALLPMSQWNFLRFSSLNDTAHLSSEKIDIYRKKTSSVLDEKYFLDWDMSHWNTTSIKICTYYYKDKTSACRSRGVDRALALW
jgi:hypothetical protein